ncbi:MAG TPA: DNA polymerase IV [Leptospiraceae bacterium]|nr:DNA polymerase IV [Leptospiraceae bacterium]HMW05218.1 DNA polymerase IV [Leptospiraceae bacterium]HMX31317.1 DNA polymerase IV [Leptospiraceae bacterium]HMY32123.1 DNA polymerase IV [Leptospiraceae bacterium]HNA05513.1 DNA polymerase IV [Leptospiraceae bacterium]
MRLRKIIHIDMDAFYASVEQRDFPEWKGKPVVVGGDPNSRSVVSTASYEARKYGIHSAMPTSKAKRLCPHAIFVYPRFSAYKQVSREIHEIFHEFTDLVEPLSLDEAYLDVTENKIGNPSATLVAKEIKKRILERTQLTSSAGVASIKFIAKIASGMNKPNGLTVITPDEAEKFLENLPIGKFYGIGEATERKMISLGIKTGLDLKQFTQSELIRHFGKSGSFYYNIVRGNDFRKVEPYRERKSIGAENTFSIDLLERSAILAELSDISDVMWDRVERIGTKGKTLTLKVKYDNFDLISRSISFQTYISSKAQVDQFAKELLNNTEVGKRKIRLLGLTISNLESHEEEDSGQLTFEFK